MKNIITDIREYIFSWAIKEAELSDHDLGKLCKYLFSEDFLNEVKDLYESGKTVHELKIELKAKVLVTLYAKLIVKEKLSMKNDETPKNNKKSDFNNSFNF